MTQGYPHLTGKSLVQTLNCTQQRMTMHKQRIGLEIQDKGGYNFLLDMITFSFFSMAFCLRIYTPEMSNHDTSH